MEVISRYHGLFCLGSKKLEIFNQFTYLLYPTISRSNKVVWSNGMQSMPLYYEILDTVTKICGRKTKVGVFPELLPKGLLENLMLVLL